MIIKQSQVRHRWGMWAWIVPPIAIVVYIVLLQRNQVPSFEFSEGNGQRIFLCDMEKTNATHFLDHDFTFEGAASQSSAFAHSGKHSIKLNAQAIYGLTSQIHLHRQASTYQLSVWRYNPHQIPSWLVVSASDPGDLYHAVQESKYYNEEDWEYLQITFTVPAGMESINLYCYLDSKANGAVYFDDLELRVFDLQATAVNYDIPQIELTVDPAGLRKLALKRKDAFKQGLLVSTDDDWVKAKVSDHQEEAKAKIRLKGDWLDHLSGDKWSFRVQVSDPNSFWRLKTFSLQKPETRGFIKEWYYHRLLKDEEILSPTYEFVLLSLNDKVLGIYALEEHFEKELIESSSKREGPILKFAEERFWSGIQRQFKSTGVGQDPVLLTDKENAFWSAEIAAFNEKQLATNPNLVVQYQRGAHMLTQFKYRQDSLAFLFDVAQLGKYLAIIDVMGAYHNLTWHNQRWYYNPVIDRLEPIGFDGFTEGNFGLSPGSTLVAEEAYKSDKDSFEPYRKLFRDSSVVAAYVGHLTRLSSVGHVHAFEAANRSRIRKLISALSDEYLDFDFDPDYVRKRAQMIRLSLLPYQNHSLQVTSNGQNQLHLTNKHLLPLLVYLDSNESGGILVYPHKQQQDAISVRMQKIPKLISYQVLGIDSMYTAEVVMTPMAQMPGSQTIHGPNFSTHPLCETMESTIVLKSGTCRSPIRIPEGYEVIVPAGCRIDFVSGNYLSSRSHIRAQGTEENPIILYSSDGTGGISVAQTTQQSYINHVVFRNLGTIAKDGHLLTGGVTFYEADVQLNHCAFLHSHEEDALNIIRSDFELSNALFDSSAFDAFDADFSTGQIRRCVFNYVGNDAMDFSGCKVSVDGCRLSHIGDKGLSVGEHSDVQVGEVYIEHAPIGVAAKDLSKLLVEDIMLDRVNTAFTAYQKKATFGPAEITVRNYQVKKVEHLHIIEAGSILHLSGLNVSMN